MPVPPRKTSPSYAWDPSLGATLEDTNRKRYFVGIRNGRIARLAPVETPAEIPASQTVRADAGKRKLARIAFRAATGYRGWPQRIRQIDILQHLA